MCLTCDNFLAGQLYRPSLVVILQAMGEGEILVDSEDRSFSAWITLKGDPDWGCAFTSSRPSPGPD
jgi:hypothetical protein